MTQRSAIVTGAAAGIGRATADLLVADGWHVVGIDRTGGTISGWDLLLGDAGDLNEKVYDVVKSKVN